MIFFWEIVVRNLSTKKEMKKHYEDYRVRSLKNKKNKNQIVTYAEYSDHKRKILKYGEGWRIPIKRNGNIVTNYLALSIVFYPIL